LWNEWCSRSYLFIFFFRCWGLFSRLGMVGKCSTTLLHQWPMNGVLKYLKSQRCICYFISEVKWFCFQSHFNLFLLSQVSQYHQEDQWQIGAYMCNAAGDNVTFICIIIWSTMLCFLSFLKTGVCNDYYCLGLWALQAFIYYQLCKYG
jgi:hypothetical protein